MIKVLAGDIETKGFYDKVHSERDVHCLCAIDIHTGELYLHHDYPHLDGEVVIDPYDGKSYTIPKRSGSLKEGILFWEKSAQQGYKLAIHNCMQFDRPVIDKVWPSIKIPFEAYHDTFIQSKVQWFERPTPKGAKSPHGLAAYALRMGIHKPEVTDWENMDAFKLHRVIEDVKAQVFCYETLEAEAFELKKKYDMDFTQALKIEALYANECFWQEVNGAKVDVEHIKRCIEDLDEKIETLRAEIEPQLPPTVKGSGGKVSRSEMTKLFGFDGSKVKDNMVERKRNGEIELVPEKPYYKPIMDVYSTKVITKYQGYHILHEFSPIFDKKKEFTDWRNENYPDTKPKEWVVDKVETSCTELKHNVCKYFECRPEDIDYICGPYTKVDIQPSTMTQSDVVKSFLIKLGLKDFEEWNLKTDINDNWIKVEEKTIVRWPENALPEHQAVKVIPKGGLMVSTPKLSEKDYEQLPEGLGKKIAEYNTYQHRRRFLENPKDPENKGLLSYVRGDGRIPCGVNNFATRSGRGAQRVWVNAPGDGALYGKEIRECLVAEEGKILVGVDMKSAQLAIAAYYANNYDYYNSVASGLEETEDHVYLGESAHCVNARMFGMVSETEWKRAVETQDKDLIHSITLRRKKSKGGSFAVIFGASGGKVAKTIGIPEKEGKERREQFLDQMGLKKCLDKLSEYEKTYKHKSGFYLPLAFGYWLWNNSSHKSFNTIDQGFEALAQKLCAIRVSKELARNNLLQHAKRVLDVHDECLYEVTKGYEDQVGKIICSAYTWCAEQIYNYHIQKPEHFANYQPPLFKIDLDGGYKVGVNYYDVH